MENARILRSVLWIDSESKVLLAMDPLSLALDEVIPAVDVVVQPSSYLRSQPVPLHYNYPAAVSFSAAEDRLSGPLKQEFFGCHCRSEAPHYSRLCVWSEHPSAPAVAPAVSPTEDPADSNP